MANALPLVTLTMLTTTTIGAKYPQTLEPITFGTLLPSATTTTDPIKYGCETRPYCYLDRMTDTSESCGIICGAKGPRTANCEKQPNCRGVDGHWAGWGAWGKCETLCVNASIAVAHRKRMRTCEVRLDLGGRECKGEAEQQKKCAVCQAEGQSKTVISFVIGGSILVVVVAVLAVVVVMVRRRRSYRNPSRQFFDGPLGHSVPEEGDPNGNHGNEYQDLEKRTQDEADYNDMTQNGALPQLGPHQVHGPSTYRLY